MTLHNPFRTEPNPADCQTVSQRTTPKLKLVENAAYQPAERRNDNWRGENLNRRGNFRSRGNAHGRVRHKCNEAVEGTLSEDFLCESCDRLFFNQRDLEDHLALHIRCPHCKFTSLHQLVDLHVKLVHEKYKASKVLEQSPEEIAEYLAERRRRFPRSQSGKSLEEGARKGVVHEENVRGCDGHRINGFWRKNKLNTSDERFENAPRKNRGQRKRRRGKARQSDVMIASASASDSQEQLHGEIAKFPNRLTLDRPKRTNSEENSESNISDSDEIQNIITGPATADTGCGQGSTVSNSGALLAIMQCYSDSDDEVPSKVTRAHSVQTERERTSNSSKDNGKDSILLAQKRSGQQIDADVRRVVYSLVGKVLAAATETGKQNVRHKKHWPLSQSMSSRKLSLLEKLLARDIRHERNILLQCVDYVVQMNFFDNMSFEI